MKNQLLPLLATCLALVAFNSCKEPVDEPEKEKEPQATEIKLISYNILEGMSSDIKGGWPNFVNWVKTQDPDILVLVEACFTREEYADLVKRFGHEYSYFFDASPAYPVAISSKYPITLLDERLCSDGDCRGSAWVRIQNINIIPLHLYYKQSVEGDAIRITEMNTILKKSIKSHPEYDNWIMCGDFNDQTKEDGRWSILNPSRHYELHEIIKKAGYNDCVRLMNPDDWCRTMQTVAHEGSGGTYRLDYIYATQTVSDCLTEAGCIKDDFTDYASDHYPIYAIFDMTKLKY